jgi:hypothetical protein
MFAFSDDVWYNLIIDRQVKDTGDPGYLKGKKG